MNKYTDESANSIPKRIDTRYFVDEEFNEIYYPAAPVTSGLSSAEILEAN
nr:hypothetical protein [Nitrosomonas aestuarii]